MTHPTDALRLVPTVVLDRLTEVMIDCKADGFYLLSESVANEHGEDLQALLNAYSALAAAPASPLPEGGGDMDWQSVAMWMGFSASVIKSGEPWSDQCQQHFDEAKAAFARLAAPTGAK